MFKWHPDTASVVVFQRLNALLWVVVINASPNACRAEIVITPDVGAARPAFLVVAPPFEPEPFPTREEYLLGLQAQLDALDEAISEQGSRLSDVGALRSLATLPGFMPDVELLPLEFYPVFQGFPLEDGPTFTRPPEEFFVLAAPLSVSRFLGFLDLVEANADAVIDSHLNQRQRVEQRFLQASDPGFVPSDFGLLVLFGAPIEVTVVPEPTAVALVALASAAAVVGRRRAAGCRSSG